MKIGDRVTLRSKGRDAEFTLVGIVQSPTQRPFLYAPSAALDTLTRDAGKAGLLMLVTERQDAAGERDTGAAVRDTLDRAGMKVAQVQTRSEIRASIDTLFTTMLLFVSVMALLLGVVGGLGLAGTMTMNVVERSREIGVMRAIGARDSAVLAVFMVEGLLIGFLAWLVGVMVSLPISKILSDALGESFVQRPLAFTPSIDGILAWLRRRRRARPRGVVPARLAGDPARRARGPGVRMSTPARALAVHRRSTAVHRRSTASWLPYRHEAPSMTANPPSSRRSRWPIALVVVIVIAIAVAVGVGSGRLGGPGAGASAQPSASLEGVVPADAGVVAEGRAVPVRWAELVPGAAGRVAAIPVAVGDTVAEGDVVLQLDDEAATIEVAVGDRGLHGGAGGDGAGGGVGRPGEGERDGVRGGRGPGAGRATLGGGGAGPGAVRGVEGRQAPGRCPGRPGRGGRGLRSGPAHRRPGGAEDRGGRARRGQGGRGAREAGGLGGGAGEATTWRSRRRSPGRSRPSSPPSATSSSRAWCVARVADASGWRFETSDLSESSIARVREGAAAKVTVDGLPGVEIAGHRRVRGRRTGHRSRATSPTAWSWRRRAPCPRTCAGT